MVPGTECPRTLSHPINTFQGMSRPLRRNQPGDIHHIFNRGLRWQRIYEEEIDYSEFLRLMFKWADDCGVEIIAFCLMGNHFHVLVRCPNGNVSAFMHGFSSIYVREFNERRGHDGPMFRARFGSRLVDTPRYLHQATRYIHRNPLDLFWDGPLHTYPWSSLQFYADDAPRPPWLRSRCLRLHLAGSDTYLRSVQQPLLHDVDQTIPSTFDPGRARLVLRNHATSDIEELISRQSGIDPSELHTTGARYPQRSAALILTREFGRTSEGELAARYGFGDTKQLRRATARADSRVNEPGCDRDRVLRNLVEELRAPLREV